MNQNREERQWKSFTFRVHKTSVLVGLGIALVLSGDRVTEAMIRVLKLFLP